MQNTQSPFSKITPVFLFLFLSAFFIHLGKRDLWSAGEARAALIAEQMQTSQDYVVPKMPEGHSYAKPPLFYWTVLFGPKEADGRIGGLATRLPSLLSSLFLIFLVAYIGEKWIQKGVGFFSALVLCTNLKFFWMARVGRIDTLLACFIFLAIIGFYHSWSTKTSRGLYLAALSCALGTLAKGPIGLFLPALVAIVTLLFFERRTLLQKESFLRTQALHLFLAFLFFLLLTLPWYLLIHYRTEGEFSKQFLFRHNVARFLGNAEILENLLDLDSTEANREFDTKQPIWYMVPRLFGDFFPWSIFLPALCFFFWKRPAPQKPDLLSFSALTALTIFLFFSLSSFKRGDYILPMFPALALLTGFYWHQMRSVSPFVLWMQKLILTSLIFFLFLFTCATFFPKALFQLPFWEKLLKDADYQNFQKIHFFFQDYFKSTALFFGVLSLSVIGFFRVRKYSAQHYFLLLATTTWLTLFLITLLFFPYFDQIRTLKPFVQEIQTHLQNQGPNQTPLIIVGNAYDFNDLHYHLRYPTQHIKTDPDPNNGYQIIQWTEQGKLQIQWTNQEPPHWEEQQWNFFFQWLAQPKPYFFLIREKDQKKIPETCTYFIYAQNKDSARKKLLLISNVPPKK